MISNECLAVISKRLFTKSNLPLETLLQNSERTDLSYFQAGMLSMHRMGSCSKGKQDVDW